MDYIAKNEELEQAETYLKNLSNHLKETYEERGKYFFVGRLSYLMTAEVIASFLLLGVTIAKSVPIAIAIILFLFTIAFFTSLALYGEDILKKAKLPIVSKSRFLNNNLLKIKSDLLIRYSLEFQYITIDYEKIEFHLNQKALAKFKNIKK
jgi:hypothetical protein